MYRSLALIFVFIIGSHGNAVENVGRQGDQNSYLLYTRDNTRDPVVLSAAVESIVEIPVRLRLNTAIIIHGHQGSADTTLNPLVKDAFLSSEDMNVIVVDWSTIAALRYSNAVASVPSVATELTNFIELMVVYQRTYLDRLHIVGFGLGAHVAGHTGRYLQQRGMAVARITGLDPAGSSWGSRSGRLTSTDARYVEVIHTDGHGLAANGIGTALGHVDFFANGGSSQPGCLLHACSHNRAWQLFAASLTHNSLLGHFCSSDLQLKMNLCRGYTLLMGNNEFLKFGSGTFRVNTGRTYPY